MHTYIPYTIFERRLSFLLQLYGKLKLPQPKVPSLSFKFRYMAKAFTTKHLWIRFQSQVRRWIVLSLAWSRWHSTSMKRPNIHLELLRGDMVKHSQETLLIRADGSIIIRKTLVMCKMIVVLLVSMMHQNRIACAVVMYSLGIPSFHYYCISFNPWNNIFAGSTFVLVRGKWAFSCGQCFR